MGAATADPGAGTKNFVILDVPVTIRMKVQADDVPQAGEVINALLGNGDWIDARRAANRLPFLIKTDRVNE
jgi:hypothetical protein